MRRGVLGLLVAARCLASAGDFVGAETCGKCHPDEFARQSATGHARALAPSRADQPGDWAFGAGSQAITFVSRVDRDTYREHGETWYRATGGFGITPGHRSAAGVTFRLFDPEARILRCFGCHSTGPLALGEEDRVVPHELSVRCEVCHGPGSAHAADPVRNRAINPAKLTASQINALCVKCHRNDLGSEAENKDRADPRNLRNQPLLLAASRCFRASQGRLTCFTCHAPHDPLERNATAYDRACQRCHGSVRHTVAVSGKACASCHMPGVKTGELVLPDHWIRRQH